MKVKIWFLAAFLLVACDGFSLQADLENSEGKANFFQKIIY